MPTLRWGLKSRNCSNHWLLSASVEILPLPDARNINLGGRQQEAHGWEHRAAYRRSVLALEGEHAAGGAQLRHQVEVGALKLGGARWHR